MALADYTPETLEVKLGRSNFYVRGLSLHDVTLIVRAHTEDVERIVDLYAQMDRASKSADLGTDLIMMMLRDMPVLAAKVILQASDEDAPLENVQRLPLPTQIDALDKIVTLTFKEVGGVKKFAEMLMSVMRKMGFSVPPASVSAKVISKLKRNG